MNEHPAERAEKPGEDGVAPRVVVIDPRFNGPKTSANGGYAAGLLGRVLPGPAEVTLRRPPPLGVPLLVATSGSGAGARAYLLSEGGEGEDGVLAEARALEPAEEAEFAALDPPARPTVDEATAAAARHPGLGMRHPLSDCVVCGPERADGFRLSTGPLADAPDVGAAVLHPDATLAGPGGLLPAEVLWAALDCPGFVPEMWARFLGQGGLTLLGRMTAGLVRPVGAAETLIAVGWPLGRDGRKDFTASALLTPSGELVARARATWITVRRPS